MMVPAYWAEGSQQIQTNGKAVTVRRFGWSDDSPIAAQAHADERTREAATRITSGATLPRRERKQAYNGADGMPIREEIVQRDGDTVITRNSYGALCLNTPDVLFVDIDFEEETPGGWAANSGTLPLALFAGVVVSATAAWTSDSWFAGIVALGLLAALLAWGWGRYRQQKGLAPAPDVDEPVEKPLTAEDRARQRLARFVAQHPDWHLRLYRTPAGLRVLVMHRTFAADDTAVEDCFHLLGADKIYARMCRNQNCFRARLTPKPWRLGMSTRLRPRPGVWPVAADKMEARQAWVAQYDAASSGHAACAFVGTMGSNTVHRSAALVQRLHDELSRAHSGLPTA